MNPLNWKAEILLLWFVFVSCDFLKVEPDNEFIACFSASVEEGKAGEEIEFANCSEGAESFTWDFGDGNTSNLREPSHTYSTAGTYEITLFAGSDTNSDGLVNGADEDVQSYRISLNVIQNVKSIELTIRDASSWSTMDS